MARVRLQHVVKHYTANVPVVKDFHLDIEDQEFVVFVGPSGCGKTTTLRMIAGLETVTAGDIFIGEKRVNDVPPKDRDIAMVFQNYALYPHMTVYQNMAFGLKLRKLPKHEIDRRVHEAAQILDIEHLLDRRPKALSGGQRQRVALGRAIVREPQVFLMDEPLSNLDAKLRVQMRAEIRKLHQRIETTMIYVTHDQVEAMTMGDRIVVMNDGVIQQCDTPAEVYHHPANLFVAGFIGSPGMNFVRGELREESGKLYFMGDGLKLMVPERRRASIASPDGGGAGSRSVVLGVRPEDIQHAEAVKPTDAQALLSAQVEVAEHMGSEIYLHVVVGHAAMVARINPRFHYVPGDRVELVLDMHRVHLFDGETGMALPGAHT
ncbi:sn-glycerol-3-phosphate ABC transporter ATP-binding protein UgpC [Alicyclobacillus cycloheptanicus]|uniref:Multiple sugar transport system ATP-binding protein n=1 Tax=Alicyclobacillus cycloheptanicus TaxID=1457 RepID=A0ABT9XJ85_9BACL|nr:sn-glycerol-3-phosphate ABC transporter ATP-binding protein UgpC [Alicyclobacillus cycloheptanicus]MDQ0189843.1 multiple sugar transport system ATP-binding protein [Alicyclobacillus cycloheptanicus]WDM02472.1 sn-glycerol-3-phosphate ABC transporter ATP-binding protein UgpC [Alicyclobacillus cycloheptanicus]